MCDYDISTPGLKIGGNYSLYNLQEGIVYDYVLSSDYDERRCAIEHMNHLKINDIMVLDRGYFSYLLLYRSVEKNIHILCRLTIGRCNKKIKEFLESHETDMVIEYNPSPTVVSELKSKGFLLDIKPIPLRLIKYKISSELYVYATTLIGDNYPAEALAELYHGRWGIEELYKISKMFIEVEDFHSQTERGVKQELYAHFLLINIARLFEFNAKNTLPTSKNKGKIMDKNNFHWQSIFDKAQKIKINFKNCLLVVGRHLYNLIFSSYTMINDWFPKVIQAIASVRQKIRPNRKYRRISYKPRSKWSTLRYLNYRKA